MSIRHNGVAQATDSSEDIGLVTARAWAKAGCRVFGTSRKLTAHTRDDTMRICDVTDEVRIRVVLVHPGVARSALEDNSARASQSLPVHASERVRGENLMRKWGDEGDVQQDIVDMFAQALTDEAEITLLRRQAVTTGPLPSPLGGIDMDAVRQLIGRPDVHAISMLMNIGKSVADAPAPRGRLLPIEEGLPRSLGLSPFLDCQVGTD